jgi:hypothetical protein
MMPINVVPPTVADPKPPAAAHSAPIDRSPSAIAPLSPPVPNAAPIAAIARPESLAPAEHALNRMEFGRPRARSDFGAPPLDSSRSLLLGANDGRSVMAAAFAARSLLGSGSGGSSSVGAGRSSATARGGMGSADMSPPFRGDSGRRAESVDQQFRASLGSGGQAVEAPFALRSPAAESQSLEARVVALEAALRRVESVLTPAQLHALRSEDLVCWLTRAPVCPACVFFEYARRNYATK